MYNIIKLKSERDEPKGVNTMTYKIEFGADRAEEMYMRIWRMYDLTENHFKSGDLTRNLCTATSFEYIVRELRAIGAETEVGIYDDNGYHRIGFARINDYAFIKNSEFKFDVLKKALASLV